VSPSHRSLPPARDQRWPTSPLFVVNISPSFGEFTAPLRHILPIHNVTINSNKFVCEFPLDVHLLRWEIVWRNEPRIWRDFGSALPFQTRLTQTKPVLPLSNEQGSQVKDQDRRQCCHNKHTKSPIGLHVMYLYFSDTPRTFMLTSLLISFLTLSKQTWRSQSYIPINAYNTILNTSHSDKAGSTTVKRARLTGKGSRSTAVLPQ